MGPVSLLFCSMASSAAGQTPQQPRISTPQAIDRSSCLLPPMASLSTSLRGCRRTPPPISSGKIPPTQRIAPPRLIAETFPKDTPPPQRLKRSTQALRAASTRNFPRRGGGRRRSCRARLCTCCEQFLSRLNRCGKWRDCHNVDIRSGSGTKENKIIPIALQLCRVAPARPSLPFKYLFSFNFTCPFRDSTAAGGDNRESIASRRIDEKKVDRRRWANSTGLPGARVGRELADAGREIPPMGWGPLERRA
jgi:hypothetical protein